MKLTDATELMKLQQRVVTKNSLSPLEVAKKVFEISATFGEPYETVTPEIWARMWLPSRKFYLAEISPSQVAVPFANRIDGEKVRRAISASADGEMEPIVVDLNRQNIGKTIAGYVPKIIVVDGKHRHKAQVQMGKDKVLAWVGELAMSELKTRQAGRKQFVIEACGVCNEKQPLMSPLMATANLYAGLSAGAGGGMGGPGGSGSLGGGSGSNPATMRVNSEAVPSSNVNYQLRKSRSSGSLQEPDPSDVKVTPDPSDSKQAVDPSDRLEWQPDKADLYPPGSGAQETGYQHDSKSNNPVKQSPGSGVGPRTRPNFGANNSDFNRGSLKFKGKKLDAGPIKVKRIITKDKCVNCEEEINAVAPPGREKQVKKLKKVFKGDDPALPFKVAWSQFNK